jgi:hypothetical protein
MRISIVLMVCAISMGACSKSEEQKKKDTAPASNSATSDVEPAAKPTAAKSAPTPAPAPTCESLGCTGDGSLMGKCDCAGKGVDSPLSAVATGGKDPTGRMEFELTNSSDRDVEWASVAIYYYDDKGVQLEAELRGKPLKMSTSNGSTMKVEAKGARKLGMGFKGDAIPAGATTVQAVFDGWCYGDVRTRDDEFCVRIDKAPADRAMAK